MSRTPHDVGDFEHGAICQHRLPVADTRDLGAVTLDAGGVEIRKPDAQERCTALPKLVAAVQGSVVGAGP